MFGFGNKKKEEEEAAAKEKAQQEQISQAMRAMSDQIAQQAQVIKQLEGQLGTAKAGAATGDAAAKALATAQAQLKQMHDEMEKIKASGAQAGKVAQGSIGNAMGSKMGPSSAPAAAAPAAAAAAPEVKAGLHAGGTAYVQQAGGKNLRLRDAAGLNSNAFDHLTPGTSMTLLSGPVDKDGYPWWHIRAADGREGWVAGTELLTHPE